MKTLDIQTETEADPDQIEQLNLKMLFFQEGKVNNLAIRFLYEFTQNQELENDAVHSKFIDKHIRVRSQSPFKVDWHVKSANAFLGSLQHFYTSQLGGTDQLKRFQNQVNANLFDSISSTSNNSVPVKDQIAAISGNMVATQEETCWLVCRLTSQSLHKDVYVGNLKLALNDKFEDFVEIVDSIGCNL